MSLTLVAKLRRSRGLLIHLRSELIRRVREKQNKDNEICSRIKCVSVAVKDLFWQL